MENENENEKEQVKAPDKIDHNDLQEFADKIGIIVALESNPHNAIEVADAYKDIKKLWKILKKKKKSKGK